MGGGVGDLGPKGFWVPLKAAIDLFFDVGPFGPRMLWNSLRAAIDLWGSCWPQQANTKKTQIVRLRNTSAKDGLGLGSALWKRAGL